MHKFVHHCILPWHSVRIRLVLHALVVVFCELAAVHHAWLLPPQFCWMRGWPELVGLFEDYGLRGIGFGCYAGCWLSGIVEDCAAMQQARGGGFEEAIEEWERWAEMDHG
jgi:hypothetical protein